MPGKLKMRSPSGHRLPAVLAAALACVPAVWAPVPARAQAADGAAADVGRVVAVADIHGAYAAFERILGRAGLIDPAGAWSGGTDVLVIVGDVLDRGPDSRRALDLIMRLEGEAEAAGGRVQLVLGNHEVMNMTGDLRYVSAEEYAAFAADESPEDRDRVFRRFRRAQEDAQDQGQAPEESEEETRARFDELFKPGFFAHREAFSADGQYGAWLLDKPLLLVLDGTAFVHGGLASAAIEYADETNYRLGGQLTEYVRALEVLANARLLEPTVDFYDHAARLNEYLEKRSDWPLGTRAAAQTILSLQNADLFSPDGPIWYRGNVSCSRLTEQDRLARALEAVGAERLVVGHTPTPGALVLSRMSETVLRVDTGMLKDYYGGRASALVIEDGQLTALYEDDPDPSAPVPQPRRVGVRPAGMTADDLEAMLARAEVVSIETFDVTARVVELTDGDFRFNGLFTQVTGEDLRPAVAAYRLDRLLGLDMVPVTVAREVDGIAGELQFLPAATISETERSAQGLGGSAWCPLSDQIRDMYVFDALIFNEARTVERILYSTENFDLLLVGQDRSFANARGRPSYLEQAQWSLTPAWRDALGALDEASLTTALADVLDRRRIRALLRRRDELLADSP